LYFWPIILFFLILFIVMTFSFGFDSIVSKSMPLSEALHFYFELFLLYKLFDHGINLIFVFMFALD